MGEEKVGKKNLVKKSSQVLVWFQEEGPPHAKKKFLFILFYFIFSSFCFLKWNNGSSSKILCLTSWDLLEIFCKFKLKNQVGPKVFFFSILSLKKSLSKNKWR